MKCRFVAGIGFLLVIGLCYVPMAASPSGRQSSHTCEQKVGAKTLQGQYLLYLPKDYADSTAKWPLLLFLHGTGGRGESLEIIRRRYGPPKLTEAGKDFRLIIVSPQCPTGQGWSTDVLDLVLKDVVRRYRVDEDRIYVTGLSMGGYGTWAMAFAYPERFAAIAPICGGGEPEQAHRIKHLPVWVFHGAKDTNVPIKESRAMVDALQRVGGNVKFTIYPEADHDSWTETYNNAALYEWFLKHHRQGSF
jgi:predicted peptidase